MLEVIEENKIENMIYEIRGKQVMLASDVAKLYHSETKVINQVVKRNINRFPTDFCFQLTFDEWISLRSQNVTSSQERNLIMHGGVRYLPFVFTEHGIMMLSGLLKSDVAVEINIRIINAFVKMRKFISNDLMQLDDINQIIIRHDNEIKLLQESLDKMYKQDSCNHIYYDGQIYDAYSKIVDIMNMAKEELIIIDGYADKSVLDIISNISVNVILICKSKSLLNKIDIDKYNSQYDNLKIIYNDSFHDRYFILDNRIVYHCGASLNYAGSKTFSINKLEDSIVINSLLDRINTIICN